MRNGLPCVLVLMGGPDAEREVSLMSGGAVAQALRECGAFGVVEQVIDAPDEGELRRIVDVSGAHVVFPVLHGQWGEGGALQRHLEAIGVPFVGAGSAAATLAMDKMRTKDLAASLGIATPPAEVLSDDDACTIDPPIVLKPVDDGSSVDLRICRDADAVVRARAKLHPKRGRLLAERFIDGAELTVGVVHGEALPIIEIVPAVEFYDYEAKYTRNDTTYHFDATLPDGLAQQMQQDAIRLAQAISCTDLSRVDYMLDERGPWMLEINTIPGFTSHSLVPMAVRHVGLEMPELCRRLVQGTLDGAHAASMIEVKQTSPERQRVGPTSEVP